MNNKICFNGTASLFPTTDILFDDYAPILDNIVVLLIGNASTGVNSTNNLPINSTINTSINSSSNTSNSPTNISNNNTYTNNFSQNVNSSSSVSTPII